jgi:hypothetical protein
VNIAKNTHYRFQLCEILDQEKLARGDRNQLLLGQELSGKGAQEGDGNFLYLD